MNEFMVSFQRWAGSADDDINLFLVGGKNCSWSYMRVTMGDLLVWALKLDPSLHQDFRLVNTMWFLLISSIKNVARSYYRFGLSQTSR
jgi:hypothetical protein